MSKAHKPTVKFPRLPIDLDKRWQKIKPWDVPEMEKLKEMGWSLRKIARKYKIDKSTVYEHLLDPEIKKARNRLKAKKRAKRKKIDKKYWKIWQGYWKKYRQRKYTLQKKEMAKYDRGRGK
jgi:hypothetical protein